MILQWFADMFYKLLTGLLGWINLPRMDPSIIGSIDSWIATIFEYGTSLFNFFVPKIVITVGFPILIAITGFKYGYYFIMWILKKIPAVGIK